MDIADEFIWVKNGITNELSADMYVRSFNNEGKKFFNNKFENAPEITGEKPYSYKKVKPDNFVKLNPAGNKSILLDIDLDYFSCCESPGIQNEVIIEITKQEYQEFISMQKAFSKNSTSQLATNRKKRF